MKTKPNGGAISFAKAYLLMIMKIYILLFSLVSFGFNMEKGFSQNTKIKFESDGKLTIEEVLAVVKKQTDYNFIYRSNLFIGVPQINIKKGFIKVGDLLEEFAIVAKVDFQFSENGGIFIKEKPKDFIKEIAQQIIKGSVSDTDGNPLPGASVVVKGTTNGITTDFDGIFELNIANENTIIQISYIGFLSQEIAVNNQTTINVVLKEDSQKLDEVVIVGYTSQRKKDIIGAVEVVDVDELNSTPSPNIVAQLQGRASGISVSSSGDPEGNSSIRIRGFASYGNNNPLYVIDGVPTTDASRLNPQDIESLQVLKDASSAAIYGARAANGVIIVTTKKGRANQTTFDYSGYSGIQVIPYAKVPEMLNTAETLQYLNLTTSEGYNDPIFGSYGSYSIPDQYIVSNDFKGGVSANDPRANPSLYTIADYGDVYQIFDTSKGTDWFRAMSRAAITQNHQISATGGTDTSSYSFGLNYFSQEGTFKYTDYERYTVRMNSSFQPTSFLTIGENFQVSIDERQGDTNLIGDQTAWANSYRSAPYVPVNDINGGWGGSLIGSTTGISWNPVAWLQRKKDWNRKSVRVFGNVFGDIKFNDNLNFRSSVGIESGTGLSKQALLQEYERTERRSVTQLTEESFFNINWTLTNTLNYHLGVGNHDIKVLLGTEAIKNRTRSVLASKSNFDFETDDFLSLNTGLPNSLTDVIATNPVIFTTTLNSYFGRIDYAFDSKYLFNATIRRDGSSVFGAANRFGTFPSVGLGWRISDESFLSDVDWINDLKLRGGWGQLGSISNVPANNQYSFYSSLADNNFYDIKGANSSSTQGFGASAQGNPDTKWETTETFNIGIDFSLANGKWGGSVDVYQKDTKDLLVPSFRNGLEPFVQKPFINLGTMRNTGIDLRLSNNGSISEGLTYTADLTFTHYKNQLTKLNNEDTPLYLSADRLNNVLLTTKGEAISSFYGYQIDGFYNSDQDINNGPLINGSPANVGTWKYKDTNGDNNITLEDRVVLGTPHPDFQLGFNFGLNFKNFDFTGFLFWNQGNELFNYTKYYTYMGVLGGGIAKGKLSGAWTPETQNTATSPRLGVGSENGYSSFVTGNSLSFYVEDGSYIRLKTLQIGYTFPQFTKTDFIKKFRMYIQSQNLFTITNYTGADPDLGLISGDGTDQYLGVDQSGFPNPKQFLLGLNLSF